MKKNKINISIMLFLLLLVTVFCGGKKTGPVVIEPGEQLEQAPRTDGTAIPVEKPKQPDAPGEKPLERPEELEVVEVYEGKPPVQSQGKPRPVVATPAVSPTINPQQSTESAPPETIPDDIGTGMIEIFRGYGYTGPIEVPENFKRRVAYYIRYFSENEKGVRFFRRAMVRGEQFLPMIRDVLAKKQLPQTLAYLPLIESGFNPIAQSRSKAIGLWQFMKGTAHMYGLKITRKIDQRKDPILSTVAAAEYLNDLLAMFGAEDPFLGVCAYNAGEGRILRALRTINYTERSFWTLVKKGILHNETNEYIPRLLAVTLMASAPAKYLAASKAIPQEMKPEEADGEDQEVLSSLLSTKDDLLESATDAETEEGEVTSSTQPTDPQAEAEAPNNSTQNPANTSAQKTYQVKRGDTMFSIAKRLNVTVQQLKKWNGLKNNRIRVGQVLQVEARQTTRAGSSNNKPAPKTGKTRLIYTVNYKDWLARIALFFDGVTARDIMNWNQLRHSRIQPGQKLVIYPKYPPKKIRVHVVRRGESARSIGKRYGVRVEFVLSLNGLLTNSKLKPGTRLNIYYF